MFKLNPYLNFDGCAEEAFNFYKSVFGGEFSSIQKYGDRPGIRDLSDYDVNKIMHIALRIGEGNVIMGSDTLSFQKNILQTGNNFYICVQTTTKEETEELFNGLSRGGEIEMALQDTHWSGYFGMIKDKYGIQWMIGYHKSLKDS